MGISVSIALVIALKVTGNDPFNIPVKARKAWLMRGIAGFISNIFIISA